MTCPNCGYCPHCGRSGYHYGYPYTPMWPTYPQLYWGAPYWTTAGGVTGISSGYGTGGMTVEGAGGQGIGAGGGSYGGGNYQVTYTAGSSGTGSA